MGSNQVRSVRIRMYQEVLSIEQIGTYQDAFSQFRNAEGSCTSAQVGPILRTFGQNPAEAEIQDGNGYINRIELAVVMQNLGETLEQEEIQTMIDEADLDGDGQINYEEFYAMMKSV